MKFVKGEQFADKEVYESLTAICTQLFHKVPSLWFEASDFDTFSVSGTIKFYVTRAKVFNGNEHVGTIRCRKEQYRQLGNVDVYRITSDRIRNQIGQINTKTTTKKDQAFKLAAKVFQQTKTEDEICSDALDKIKGEMHNIRYSAFRNVERIGDPYLVPMMEATVALYEGGLPTLGAALETMLKNPAVKQNLNTFRIVEVVKTAYDNGRGIVVKEERDGSLTSIAIDRNSPSGSRVVRMADSYGLPEIYQPKLAMLRMLEHKQAAESIGIKFMIDNINWYYMPDGEIITTS